MAALPVTGIESIDRELRRREPFSSAEAAETAAARLLEIWNALRPWPHSAEGNNKLIESKNG